jgi:hypothetical protein
MEQTGKWAGKVAPVCEWCRERRTQPHPGNREPKNGWHTVDGLHWHRWCSRRCSNEARADNGMAALTANAAREGRIAACERRWRDRLVAAVRPHVNADGLVSPVVLVREMMLLLRRTKADAYTRGLQQRHRDTLAAGRERARESMRRHKRTSPAEQLRQQQEEDASCIQ